MMWINVENMMCSGSCKYTLIYCSVDYSLWMSGLDIGGIAIANFHDGNFAVRYVYIERRVNIYKTFNILFSRNSKIFEESLELLDHVVEKYDDEKNLQYVS